MLWIMIILQYIDIDCTHDTSYLTLISVLSADSYESWNSFTNIDDKAAQGVYAGRGRPTASPMLTAIMSGGVGISGREMYKYR